MSQSQAMNDQIQSRLLSWATAFLFVYSIILTLSPAVRERTWDVDYRWSHWVGFAIWLVLISLGHYATAQILPDRDPYIFPAAALLSGWGLLTIWRLNETFGLRQAIWLIVSIAIFIIGLRLPSNLVFIRRYKYILLSGGLLLTALTLIFGTHPSGFGPRLWLGCCGFYFQPSEPLKLLLVAYLAAYLADRLPIRMQIFPLLLPTIFVTGLALLILFVQRDLGTASIFILLYTVILYLATGRQRVLISTAIGLAIALLVGYISVDVIRTRVDGWLDPWVDPAGQSYQIVQSLLAVANGGMTGRGPGIGNPGLVPVAISDFIFAAIAEEAGLVGTIGLIATIWLIVARGMIASLQAQDRFRRFLAAGITTYLGIQSLLIIGGNLRLFPLTGVTLPFVSYGGSSLLTSYTALLILIIIGGQSETEPAPLENSRPHALLTGLLGIGFAAAALTVAWWAIVRSPDLLNRTDNPRRAIADRYVPRGSLLDRNNHPINVTRGTRGTFRRVYLYPELGSIVGYTHPVYGQAGLEASLDDYLRGLKGNPASLIWWEHLLYGTPPTGNNARVSLDLTLQAKTDELLDTHAGAIILMNAQTGEILAMASHPTFDPNKLDEDGLLLTQDAEAPLLNRATQGQYPINSILDPLIQAQFREAKPADSEIIAFYKKLGLFNTPVINMPVNPSTESNKPKEIRVSPLHVALAAAALSNHGVIPSPRIAIAVDTTEQGWVDLSTSSQPVAAIQAEAADEAASAFIVEQKPFWGYTSKAGDADSVVSWFIAGTLPDWQGSPLVVVVTLEEDNSLLAKSIGSEVLTEALSQ